MRILYRLGAAANGRSGLDLLKLFDAVLTAPLAASSERQSRESPNELGTRGKYRRVQELVNRGAARFPNTTQCLQRCLYKAARLPLRGGEHATLLDYGSGSTVYLIPQGSDEGHVLKIYRSSLGRRTETLIQQAIRQRRAYDTLCAVYAGCEVVVPTVFLVLHGPVVAAPALAAVQPFFPQPCIDLFTGLSEDTLVDRLMSNRVLRAQFITFVDRTACFLEKRGACPDLLGPRNLVLTGEGDATRLRLIDVWWHELAGMKIRRPQSVDVLMMRLDYLKRVKSSVSTNGLSPG